MLKQRTHYWSCSKFAEWILAEKKPIALEWGEWDHYYDDLKKRKPIRYWISQKFLKTLQNIIYFPYDVYHAIDVYIRNRWIDKTHYLHTGLKPGRYYELDHRILNGLFNELVDFVEIELANSMRWDSSKKYKFKHKRCIEAAYDYFKWAGKLRDTYPDGKTQPSEQAKTSRTIKQLYEWWKNKRPQRPDPYEASGWNKVCDIDKDFLGGNFRKQKQALNKLSKLEEKYDDEDTNMLIDLIKIRRHLWS